MNWTSRMLAIVVATGMLAAFGCDRQDVRTEDPTIAPEPRPAGETMPPDTVPPSERTDTVPPADPTLTPPPSERTDPMTDPTTQPGTGMEPAAPGQTGTGTDPAPRS